MVALVVSLSAILAAAPQPPANAPPVSLERIREELEKPPERRLLDTPLQAPVATFKTRVDQRMFVPTFDEWLRKEFQLTALQRQSAEWGSKCCGLNLLQVFKGAKAALRRAEARRIRQQIERELAELEAARKTRKK